MFDGVLDGVDERLPRGVLAFPPATGGREARVIAANADRVPVTAGDATPGDVASVGARGLDTALFGVATEPAATDELLMVR